VKLSHLFLLTLLFLFQISPADDIRSKVTDLNEPGLKNNIIDPDNHIFGMPWGSTEDEVIEAWGKPTGYISFGEDRSGMFFGRHYIFLFDKGKLAGLIAGIDVLQGGLVEKIIPGNMFDNLAWRLNNGIESGTEWDKVDQIIIGSAFASEIQKDFKRAYETEMARVTFYFTHSFNGDEHDQISGSIYSVRSVKVELK